MLMQCNAAGCIDHTHSSWVGDLYIGISTWASYGVVKGQVMFELAEPALAIKADQLAAVKDLFVTCCKPRGHAVATCRAVCHATCPR